ncbi:MAG: methyl-accepting chemotaxis protein [Acidobacteria bacterium]|nr:methyl-accepting chemotaxis protein [Acidobacteriota bacterium]
MKVFSLAEVRIIESIKTRPIQVARVVGGIGLLSLSAVGWGTGQPALIRAFEVMIGGGCLLALALLTTIPASHLSASCERIREQADELETVLTDFRLSEREVLTTLHGALPIVNGGLAETERLRVTLDGHTGQLRELESSFGELSGQIDMSRELLQQINESMQAMQTASQQVGDVIKMIDKIAFRTKLIALNAAIEAAHAGDSGACFGVVADEVRTLSGTVDEAAKRSAALIEECLMQVDIGVAMLEEASSNLTSMTGTHQGIAEVVTKLSSVELGHSGELDQVGEALQTLSSQYAVVQSGVRAASQHGQRLRAANQEMRLLAGTLGKFQPVAEAVASQPPTAPVAEQIVSQMELVSDSTPPSGQLVAAGIVPGDMPEHGG